MNRVLVVEDERVTNTLISRFFQQNGWAVLQAEDVPQAIAMLTRCEVHAVILDIRIPGGSGLDVVQKMKASNRLGPIPIVAMSMSMTPELVAELKRSGVEEAYSKPLDLQAIKRLLEEAVATRAEEKRRAEARLRRQSAISSVPTAERSLNEIFATWMVGAPNRSR